ncbi:hypothetical protein HAX54_029051 [Datura stramonium]|uniref:Uncharacterized protein n=1 Tax=Datura stramonium TaxID=4076 RepID=A0ABS8SA13_DATST|nr:hypothetical protein [Datura stramonium]
MAQLRGKQRNTLTGAPQGRQDWSVDAMEHQNDAELTEAQLAAATTAAAKNTNAQQGGRNQPPLSRHLPDEEIDLEQTGVLGPKTEIVVDDQNDEAVTDSWVVVNEDEDKKKWVLLINR